MYKQDHNTTNLDPIILDHGVLFTTEALTNRSDESRLSEYNNQHRSEYDNMITKNIQPLRNTTFH